MPKLVGQNYTTPDLVAKVTGKAKYAEDFRAEGMLFAKLLLSPMPHARVVSIDTSAALAMPGVKAILTVEDLPGVAAGAELGENVRASTISERGLTMEPLYEGEPILAVAAIDEYTAAAAVEAIQIEYEPLPFAVDPIASLRPGGANARETGNVWMPPTPPAGGAAAARGGAQGAQGAQAAPGARGAEGAQSARARAALRDAARRKDVARLKDAPARPRAARKLPHQGRGGEQAAAAAPGRGGRGGGAGGGGPQVGELKWTDAGVRRGRRQAAAWPSHDRVAVRQHRSRLQGSGARPRRNLRRPEHEPSVDGAALGDGLLAERQAVPACRHAEHRPDRRIDRALGRHPGERHRLHQRIHRRRLRQPHPRLHRDGDPGAPLEEGERAGDDAHHARRGSLHRACASGPAHAGEGRLREGRPHHRARLLRGCGERSLRSGRRRRIGRDDHLARLSAEEHAVPRPVGADQHAAPRRAARAGRDAGRRGDGADPGEGGASAGDRRGRDPQGQRAGRQGAVRRAEPARPAAVRDERVREGSAGQGRGDLQLVGEESPQRPARRHEGARLRRGGQHLLRRVDWLRRPADRPSRRQGADSVGRRQSRHARDVRRAPRRGGHSRRDVGAVRGRLRRHEQEPAVELLVGRQPDRARDDPRRARRRHLRENADPGSRREDARRESRRAIKWPTAACRAAGAA